MLEISNLHVSVDGRQILRGIDLNVAAGEVHAIMGPNGSGKSTLAYVLAGREGYDVTDGSVTFKGEDLLEKEPDERCWSNPRKRPTSLAPSQTMIDGASSASGYLRIVP